jgi:hypothetical protein
VRALRGKKKERNEEEGGDEAAVPNQMARTSRAMTMKKRPPVDHRLTTRNLCSRLVKQWTGL